MNKQEFSNLVQTVTNAFRCGHEGRANTLLVEVFDQMLPLCNQVSAQDMQFIQSVMPILADAQQRGDMIYLSDILQYEVLPRIMNS